MAKGLDEGVDDFSSALKEAVAPLNALGEAAKSLAAVFLATEGLERILDKFSDTVREMALPFRAIGAVFSHVGEVIRNLIPHVDSVGDAFVLLSAATKALVRSTLDFAKDLPGVLLKGLGGILTFLLPIASRFVAALNPGLMQNFSLALRDLSATAGVAFEPLFIYLTQLARQIAGVILPLMQQLAAPIRELGHAIGDALLVYVRLLAFKFQIWVSLISLITPLLQALASAVAQLQAPILAFADWISALVQEAIRGWQALVGGTIQGGVTSLATALQRAVSYLVIFAAALGKFFGYDKFVSSLVKRYSEAVKPTEGGAVASQPVQVGRLEDVARELARSAALAGTGPSKEDQEAEERKAREEEMRRIQQETLDALKEIQKAGAEDKLLAFLQENFPTIAAALQGIGVVQEGLVRIVEHILDIIQTARQLSEAHAEGQSLDERLRQHHRDHGIPPPKPSDEGPSGFWSAFVSRRFS